MPSTSGAATPSPDRLLNFLALVVCFGSAFEAKRAKVRRHPLSSGTKFPGGLLDWFGPDRHRACLGYPAREFGHPTYRVDDSGPCRFSFRCLVLRVAPSPPQSCSRVLGLTNVGGA